MKKILRFKSPSRLLGSIKTVFGLVAIMLMAGCASSLDISLKGTLPDRATSSSHTLPYSLGVDTFVDLRPQAHSSSSKRFLGLMPGVFWLTFDSDLPENHLTYTSYNPRPLTAGIAEAVADHLTQSNLFEKVGLVVEDDQQQYDYKLEGVIRRSFVRETGYYYGLSIHVLATRLLGLPYVSYKIALNVDLRLRDNASNEIVWETTIQQEREDKWNNIYKMGKGKDGKNLLAYNFTKILEDTMPAVVGSLKEQLSKKNELQ